MAKMKVEPHPFLVVPPLFTRDPLAARTSPYLVSVTGKALMRDSSAVIIQVLDIVTSRMLYSNNWDVNDFSAFLICDRHGFVVLPFPTGRFCGTLMKSMVCPLRRDRDILIVTC
jgi:hypothetical protein